MNDVNCSAYWPNLCATHMAARQNEAKSVSKMCRIAEKMAWNTNCQYLPPTKNMAQKMVAVMCKRSKNNNLARLCCCWLFCQFLDKESEVDDDNDDDSDDDDDDAVIDSTSCQRRKMIAIILIMMMTMMHVATSNTPSALVWFSFYFVFCNTVRDNI
jgi:hypothetical protein